MIECDLSDRTAVVSGGSSGIGWGCAKALAQCGATVVLVAMEAAKLDDAGRRIAADVPGARVRTFAADLTVAQGCDALFAAEPGCDILLNNLGAYSPKPFCDTRDEDWRQALDVNLLAGVRLSRAYMPGMTAAGWGRIVFISSVDGVAIPTDAIHYGVAKAGVLALSRGLAKLAGTSGVTVNAVLPGVTGVEWVETELKDAAIKEGKSLADVSEASVVQRYPTSITRRVQAVDEVANLVAYLSSPLSSATTGSAFRADGGILELLV